MHLALSLQLLQLVYDSLDDLQKPPVSSANMLTAEIHTSVKYSEILCMHSDYLCCAGLCKDPYIFNNYRN